MKTNSSAIIIPQRPPATAAVTNDIRDIKPPVPLPNPWVWAWWGLGFLMLAAAALVVWKLWRKKQQEAQIAPFVPPHVRAKHKLADALRTIGDPRLFCTLVSDALRVYLEERYDVHAPERTTEEFLNELQQTPILSLQQKQRLAEFLESCDLVKFAQFEPHETELRALFDTALRLVEETQFQALALAQAPMGNTPPVPEEALASTPAEPPSTPAQTPP